MCSFAPDNYLNNYLYTELSQNDVFFTLYFKAISMNWPSNKNLFKTQALK